MTIDSIVTRTDAPISRPDRFFIGGEWVAPSTDSVIPVIDSATEELFFNVAEAQAADMDRAIGAARAAFDEGPWPRMAPAQRATYLRAMGEELKNRALDAAQIWTRESGMVYSKSSVFVPGIAGAYAEYAGLSDTFPFEERTPEFEQGDFRMLVREPVGVVGAIIPWNGPMLLITHKILPALMAGCTVVLKASPEAPGNAYLIAEVAEAAGLPRGVLNVVTADRAVSELLVRDPRVDKISFTGSTAAGRKIASIAGGRIARVTLELGGKSAAVILDDADLDRAASRLALAECTLTGQSCSSLTRIVVSRHRHDEFVEALVSHFSAVKVGDPFDPASGMGPLATPTQRNRVLGYVEKARAEGTTLATGGGRPAHLDRGWFVEPTVFSSVDNSSTIAQEEVFGPVLSVIPADDEADAIRIANDTIYGLNAAVFTDDADRAYELARQLRSGTVGHNDHREDWRISFGGFKQSGLGREGGREGMIPYLENKTVILDSTPSRFLTA